jgi:hypothetical protein
MANIGDSNVWRTHMSRLHSSDFPSHWPGTFRADVWGRIRADATHSTAAAAFRPRPVPPRSSNASPDGLRPDRASTHWPSLRPRSRSASDLRSIQSTSSSWPSCRAHPRQSSRSSPRSFIVRGESHHREERRMEFSAWTMYSASRRIEICGRQHPPMVIGRSRRRRPPDVTPPTLLD